MPLPQEILNLIIDLIAWEKPRQDALDTLRTCSLVSISFHFQSRKHLFSEIDFYADNSTQKRAQRLFTILVHKSNRDLVPGIRAFKLIIDVGSVSLPKILKSAGVNQFYQQSRAILLRIVAKFGPPRNYLHNVLELLSRSPLQSFAIEAQNGVLKWNVGERADSLFLTIRAGSSLRSLRFINIADLDRSLVMGKGPSPNLRELGLWSITLSHRAPLFNTNLAGIERLDIMPKSDYSQIFPELESSSPAQHLPDLKTLVVAFPPTNVATMDMFWQMVKSFAPSLKTLEIRDIWWRSLGIPLPPSISLSHLSVLKNLKLCAASGYPNDHFYVKLQTMKNLLTSATSPLTIECITIDLELRSKVAYIPPREILYPGGGTNALDLALTSPMLGNLRKVVFDVRLVTYPSTKLRQTLADDQAMDDAYVRNLLPRVSALASIKLEVSIVAVFRKNRAAIVSPS